MGLCGPGRSVVESLNSRTYMYFTLLVVVILTAIALVAVALGIARAISPRSYNPQKGEAYECGIPTRGRSWMQFKVGYYLFAILFLMFDVETVFLFSWAVVVQDLGVYGLVSILFFLIVLVLLVYGIVMMFSASYIEGMTEYQDGYHFVKAQAFAAVLGIAVMLILSFWDYHFFQKRWVALSAFGILTVIMLYTSLFGYENAGAKRWLVIPGMGMVQPSEFYKLALIILLSWWITRQLKKPVDMKTQVIFYTLVLGLCGGLLFLQRHMSGVMIFMIIGMGIIFIGGIKWKTLGRLILVLAACRTNLYIISS